jgi:hypothetical protein
MLRTTKIFATAALALAGLMSIPAFGQNSNNHDRDRNGTYGNGSYNNVDAQNRARQTGVADGQWDLQHGQQQRNRNWRTTAEAQAYRDGYNSTVSAHNGQNGRHGRRNRGWGNNGNNANGNYNNGNNGNGNYNNGNYNNGNYNNGQYGNNAGSRQGFTDGRNDGAADAQGGFNYRPTEKYAYKDSNHGLKESGMSKDAFVQSYKPAYLEGYKQSYYSHR